MRFLVVILLIKGSLSIAQQSKDTLFFGNDWKISTREKASFFRLSEKQGELFLITDKYFNDKIQMTAYSTSVESLNKSGKAVYYNKEGYRTQQGFYNNNLPIGHWVWYYENEADSSVADYNSDGTKHYSRISTLDRNVTKTGEDIFTVVEEMPQFPGGVQEMFKYIGKNINYPKEARKKNIEGKVYVRFVIDQQGNVTKAEVAKGSGNDFLDKEALRVVDAMPQWSVGTQNGKKVNVLMMLPVSFVLKS